MIVVDFAGTLVKTEVIDEANRFRAKVLERGLPTKEEHGNPKELYKINREFVSKLTGIREDMQIHYRKNDNTNMELKGEGVLNQISTTLFQIGMYMVAKKYGKEIFYPGMVEELGRVKDKGLAIVSGVRTDIISGIMRITGIKIFQEVIGQAPALGLSNTELLEQLQDVEFVIGDKLSDIEPAKKLGARSVFVKWGHASGGEEEAADYIVNEPKDLRQIL